ncbi:hypothetical protein B0H19DRAFT_922750, partial [Mycena capillaripes]
SSPRTSTMNPSTLVFAKGIADIGIGLVLFAKPAILYESVATKAIASITGLYITNASLAPGFNHSIACMVAAVGIGNLVAVRSGPAALPPICMLFPPSSTRTPNANSLLNNQSRWPLPGRRSRFSHAFWPPRHGG